MGPRRDQSLDSVPERDGHALQHVQEQQAFVGADLAEDEGARLRPLADHVHGQVAEPAQGVQEGQGAGPRVVQNCLLQGLGGASW